MKVTVIPIVIRALDTVTKCLVHGVEDLEIRGRVGTIVKTDHNTEKSPGNLVKNIKLQLLFDLNLSVINTFNL